MRPGCRIGVRRTLGRSAQNFVDLVFFHRAGVSEDDQLTYQPEAEQLQAEDDKKRTQ